MNTFFSMLKNVIIFILLAVPGYVLVKCKCLKSEHSGVLSKLLTLVGMPFLILSGTLGVDLNGKTALNLLWSALISTVLTLFFFFLSSALATDNKSNDALWNKKVNGMERFCAIFSNNGFLGLPLAAAVFGASSKVVTYLVVANIVNNTLIYTLGTYLVSGDKQTIDIKKVFLNPVLISFVLGIILNLVGVKKYLPEIQSYSDYFKGIVTPLSMTILGIKMAGIKLSALFTSWKNYYVAFIKLVLIPVFSVAVTLIFYRFAGLDENMVMTMFIAFAMPTAALSTALADAHNGDADNGTVYTLSNTVLSVVTIPLLYLLLCLII